MQGGTEGKEGKNKGEEGRGNSLKSTLQAPETNEEALERLLALSPPSKAAAAPAAVGPTTEVGSLIAQLQVEQDVFRSEYARRFEAPPAGWVGTAAAAAGELGAC